MYITRCAGKFEYFLVWYGDHWALGTIFMISLMLFLLGLAKLPFEIYRATLRASVLKKHGWPPEHLTIDGDQTKL